MPALLEKENTFNFFENSSKGSVFDISKSRDLYFDLVKIYGPIKAFKIALETFSEDFRSLAWEATKTPLPYSFFYRIIKEGESVKLIHQSDLHWQKDILEGVSPRFRRGLEFAAISNFRRELIEAEIGESRFLISSKKDEGEQEEDCPYTDTQINIAEKVGEDLILVRQFQSDHLDKEHSIKIFNLISEEQRLDINTNIDTLITSIGRKRGHISTEKILEYLSFVSGQKIKPEEIEKYKDLQTAIDINSSSKAEDLLFDIRRGLKDKDLSDRFANLLALTIGFMPGLVVSTSCGSITFEGASENIRGYSWQPSMSVSRPNESSEGIKCPHCKEINTCNKEKCYKCKKSLKDG